ncbi:MAG: hypothetical protein ACKOU7_08835 [Ferruginibacter sp.]
MKKIILIITIVLFSVNPTRACEICGCGQGNYYFGLMPQFKHHFIGLRYQYKKFNTVMADDPTQFSRDHYKTMELWGGWNFGKKWQVLAVIPYNFVHQVSDDGITNNQGIGDIALMVNYKLFSKNTTTAKGRSVAQQFWVGAGVKMPTGKFNVDATDPALVSLANTQTGTASTDFMLNAMYNVSINKVGLNTSASYKLNTTNSDHYTFGNRFFASSILSYAIKKSQVSILPNFGFMYEQTGINKLEKQKVEQTGGNLLSAAAGLEAGYKKFTVGTNLQLPLSQDFASGQTEVKLKGMLHITYSF